MKTLFFNIGQLLTNAPLASKNKLTNIKEEDLGFFENAWLLVEDGKVLDFGSGAPLETDCQKVDLNGNFVMPGLVDSHTHPVFAGDRSNEFYKRLNGKTYAEIAADGGGIKASMKHTKEASYEELKNITKKHINSFLSFGVTTVETKSGYGLSVEEEVRHLKILKELKDELPLKILSTCLTLHAIPEGFKNENEYIEKVGLPVLEKVIEDNLADYVDAFIENGYFSVENTRSYFEEASKSGLKIRLHADEFTDAGAAHFSGELKANSADHLQFASDKGIEEMAKNKVVATLLPGTSIYTNIPFTDGKKFISKGCPVAVASDFNPGSCVIDNLPQLASIAALHCGLTAVETLAAVTYVPAHSLDLSDRKGALAKGFDADFIVHECKHAAGWLADIGRNKPSSVYIKGQKII